MKKTLLSDPQQRVSVERGIYRRGERFVLGWRDASDKKWRTRTLPAGTTLQAAQRERDAVLGKTAVGETMLSSVSKVTLAQVAARYFLSLEAKVANGSRSNLTLKLNRSLWRDHLEPSLGTTPVRRITADDVEALITLLGAKGLAGATVNKIVSLLSALMVRAMRSNDAALNPVALIRPEERPSNDHTRERRALTDDELALLAEKAGSGQTRRLIVFLAGSGLRLSECLALYPSEVEGGLVRVSEQLERCGEARIPTKTPTSVRTVALFADAATAVKEQEEWRLKVGARASRWLWTTPTGRPLDQTNVQTAIRSAAQKAGLGAVSPHELRYTFASRLDEAGVSLADAAAELGHKPSSHAAMTTKYLRSRGVEQDRHARIRAKTG